MSTETIVGAVLLLVGGVGLGGLIGYVFGFVAGQHSNADGFRTLAEHITRDPENWTGA